MSFKQKYANFIPFFPPSFPNVTKRKISVFFLFPPGTRGPEAAVLSPPAGARLPAARLAPAHASAGTLLRGPAVGGRGAGSGGMLVLPKRVGNKVLPPRCGIVNDSTPGVCVCLAGLSLPSCLTARRFPVSSPQPGAPPALVTPAPGLQPLRGHNNK